MKEPRDRQLVEGPKRVYAYYHCRPGCRAVNVTKAKLEGLFVDELALLQPTPGYMVERSIDIETYDRHAEKLREELTLVRIERVTQAISKNST